MPHILLSSGFFGFNLGELLLEGIQTFIKLVLGDVGGMLRGAERFVSEQYRLAFGFKSLFNNQIENMLSSISNVTTYFALFLIVLIFLKKGVECYILWTDGDPDVSPSQLTIRFAMAIIVAVSMRLLYDWVLRVATELIAALDTVANIRTGSSIVSLISDVLSMNLLLMIFGLIAIIMIIVAGFKLIGDGLILTILHWILPVTCIGLLDNDKGLFNETWKAFVRTVSTVIIKYYVLQVGIYIIVNTNGGLLLGLGGILSYSLAIVVLGSSNKIANLLTQIFVPVQQGGGIMQKAYPAMMVGGMAGRLIKR